MNVSAKYYIVAWVSLANSIISYDIIANNGCSKAYLQNKIRLIDSYLILYYIKGQFAHTYA